ncbi:MAG: M23 family metallopeptidase [Mollicutes bacterium]|nr:M23 family metallopeptidase [Mollicutes bacterium]
MNKYSKILLPTFYIGIIAVMVLCSTLVVSGVKTYLLNRQEMKFTIDNVFDEDTTPVVKTETNIIVKPYISDSVKVGRYFYDFESDEKKQENSLILYEDTYMQNNGVDYVDNKNFDVVAILDGEIISIEDSDVYGKVVTIKHNDNLKSVYSNVDGVLVTVGYKIHQGEIFAMSAKSKLQSDYESMLHFEVFYKESAIDPENMYTMSVSDFQ